MNRAYATAVSAVAMALLITVTPATGLDPNRTLTQYSHRIWGLEEGLVEPTIYSILQTRDGYLWLGTQDGLIRFDGLRFRLFDESTEIPFPRSLVRSLYQDKSGNLWIGSIGSGLGRVAPDGAFRRYTTKDGLPSDDVFCVAADRQGRLLICTDRGLVTFDGTRFQVYTTAAGLPTDNPALVCSDTAGTQWIAGFNFGLGQWNGTHFLQYDSSPALSTQRITALRCAHDGSVWVGTNEGLTQITNSGSRTFSGADGLAGGPVYALSEAPDGSLFVGSRDGVTRYKPSPHGQPEFSVYGIKDGLSHSSVLSLYLDREGSLWAGTRNGLNQFSDGNVTPYTTHEGMPSNDTGPVLDDSKGRLWVGTQSSGIALYDGHSFQQLTTRDGLSDNHILALALDPQGDVWAGTANGLTQFRGTRAIATFSPRDGLSGRQVQALFVDLTGTLWIGTDQGLDVFENQHLHRATGGFGVAPSSILALSGGQRTRLLVSSDPGGLSVFRDGAFHRYPLPGITQPISCYYFDQVKHTGWMGTAGSGLLRWQNGAITRIRVKDGLYDNRIYSILRDGRENFWLASSKGIFRVSESDLERFAAGKLRTISSVPFSTGQLRFECQSGVQPASCKTRDGRLWFSTSSGLVMIDPAHLAATGTPPPVRITTTVVNGQRVNLDQPGPLKLLPFEKNFEIHYAGLSFVSPEKISFRYILEGFDKQWTEAGSRREAFFTNLPPGHFRFRVQARNADGIASAQDAVVDFTILPLLYQRPWFWPLAAALLALAAVFVYQLRIRRLKAEFDLVIAERSRIARELHDTLLQGLSGVTMQLQALWTKLPLTPERETLADIIKDAGHCSTEARQSLWGLRLMDSQSLPFSSKLTKLARQMTASKSVGLSLELDRVSLSLFPETEYQLMRIVQEALSNALRHAGPNAIEVVLRVSNRRLKLSITDDGSGFEVNQNAADLGHFGLVGMRERAAEIGATLAVTSSPEQGTCVVIDLPLPRNVTAEGDSGRLLEHQVR